MRANLLCPALVTCRVAGSLSFAFTVQRVRGPLDEMSVVVLRIVAQSAKHYESG